MYSNERSGHATPEDASGGVAGTLVGDEEAGAAAATARQRGEREKRSRPRPGVYGLNFEGPASCN